MQLFFESQQAEAMKLLGKEGDLVAALTYKSGQWDLPVAVGAHNQKCFCKQRLLLRLQLLLLQLGQHPTRSQRYAWM